MKEQVNKIVMGMLGVGMIVSPVWGYRLFQHDHYRIVRVEGSIL